MESTGDVIEHIKGLRRIAPALPAERYHNPEQIDEINIRKIMKICNLNGTDI